MSTMQAIRMHEYGNPSVLKVETAPRPEPGDGEVLIRVFATTVNPFDCAVRAGYMAAISSTPSHMSWGPMPPV